MEIALLIIGTLLAISVIILLISGVFVLNGFDLYGGGKKTPLEYIIADFFLRTSAGTSLILILTITVLTIVNFFI